jgi:hypothetical protein
MTFENAANQVIESFNRGIFPAPHEFSNAEIEAIATIRGIDSQGTFADAPMEQSLICEYKLYAANGENKWPVFAKVLQEEKSIHFSQFSSLKPGAIKQLNEVIAMCLMFGITHEEISEQLEFV